MRALIETPARVTPGLYRRFVQRAQVAALLPDHLVVGEPYLALNAIVLEPAEAELLAELSARFASAFERAGRALCADVAGLIEMGFPWLAAELLAAEAPRQPIVGRFDFTRDERGHWWLLEFNADTPSGVRETIALDALVRELVVEARGLTPRGELATALVDAFAAATAGLAPGSGLGLVTSAGELEDLAQMAFTQRLLCHPLAERGIEVVLGDVHNLTLTRRGARLCGRPISGVYRYVPFETMLGTHAWAALFTPVAEGTLRLLNGLFGLLLQHKGLMAWLWEHRNADSLEGGERAAVRDHLPPTWRIGEQPAWMPRERLVAKQVFGREGEEVYFGEEMDEAAWRGLERQRTFVVQQRVQPQVLAAVVPTSTGPVLRHGHVSLGSFVVSGRWAGFYTRFGQRIITSRAKWMATLVG